jgi:hypothetical protein
MGVQVGISGMEVRVLAAKPLDELVKELPPDVEAEVRDFIEFLLSKRRRVTGTLRQDWAGALRDVRDRYTSLSLEQQALAWRGD